MALLFALLIAAAIIVDFVCIKIYVKTNSALFLQLENAQEMQEKYMYKIAEHILYEDDKLLVCVNRQGLQCRRSVWASRIWRACFGIILLQKERLPLLESSIA